MELSGIPCGGRNSKQFGQSIFCVQIYMTGPFGPFTFVKKSTFFSAAVVKLSGLQQACISEVLLIDGITAFGVQVLHDESFWLSCGALVILAVGSPILGVITRKSVCEPLASGIISEDSLLLALRRLVFWTISSGSIMFNNLFFRNDAKVHETLDILQ
jgi:hypothetical protein